MVIKKTEQVWSSDKDIKTKLNEEEINNFVDNDEKNFKNLDLELKGNENTSNNVISNTKIELEAQIEKERTLLIQIENEHIAKQLEVDTKIALRNSTYETHINS